MVSLRKFVHNGVVPALGTTKTATTGYFGADSYPLSTLPHSAFSKMARLAFGGWQPLPSGTRTHWTPAVNFKRGLLFFIRFIRSQAPPGNAYVEALPRLGFHSCALYPQRFQARACVSFLRHAAAGCATQYVGLECAGGEEECARGRFSHGR